MTLFTIVSYSYLYAFQHFTPSYYLFNLFLYVFASFFNNLYMYIIVAIHNWLAIMDGKCEHKINDYCSKYHTYNLDELLQPIQTKLVVKVQKITSTSLV